MLKFWSYFTLFLAFMGAVILALHEHPRALFGAIMFVLIIWGSVLIYKAEDEYGQH